jgi:tetratricopeptide (TPR) repeat protein
MNLLRRLFWRGSVRNEVLSLYKRGMACAQKKDAKGALEAYTSAIERPSAPDDLKAMALYNRAIIFAAGGNTDTALNDLQAILQMAIPMSGVKLAARRRLERLQHRRDTAVQPMRRSS